MRNNAVARYATLLIAILLMAVVATSCVLPPEPLGGNARGLADRIEVTKRSLAIHEADFKKKLGTSEFAFVKSYSPAHSHSDRFGVARTKVGQAETAYRTQVKPVLDDYSDAKQQRLQAAVASTDKLLREADALAADPVPWLDTVLATKKNQRQVVRDAAQATERVQGIHGPLAPAVDNVHRNYASKSAEVDRRFKPLTDQHAAILAANGLLQAEARKNTPNYALMAGYADTVQRNAKSYLQTAPQLQAQVTSLGVRETHTLLDMRVDNTVTITRVSMYEGESPDGPEHEFVYPPRKLDTATANYFAQFGADDVLATQMSGSGFSTPDTVDRKQWDKLHIDPKKAWPKDDNTASFYSEVAYCHKIRVVKNGNFDSSGRPNPADNPCSKYDNPAEVSQGIYWVEADELDANALGMDVYSKSPDDFVDQASTGLTPPGMAYVGDPSTGQWATNANGDQYWDFNDTATFLFFTNMIGGSDPYHYRSHYSEWNRGYRYTGKPYYAPYRGKPRFGKGSPLYSLRVPANSAYKTTGLSASSVRIAGPASRGDGPGGGGK